MSEDYFEMDVAAYLLKRESDSGSLTFDKVEEAGMALSEYYDRVRQQKRRPFSAVLERLGQQRQSVREMFRMRLSGLEPGSEGNDDAELGKLTAPLPATPTLQKQIANVAQFALDSGYDVETVSADYPLFVRAYAKNEMRRETATDDEVYEHMGAKHDLRDHLKASAWQMGVLGERPRRAFRTWVKQARKEQLKGWQQEKIAEYEKAYLDQYQMSRTATEVGIPAAMAVSGVPGAGFLMVPGRPEPLVKGVDGSLGIAREDGKGLREVARPDPYRGLVIADVHQAHRVVDEAGDTPVYMPNQVPADAQMRDEREAARGVARVERPSGRPGMAPVLEAPGEFSMERPYDFAGNARAAESSIVGSRTRNEEHYAAEGKRHGAFLESLQAEINAKRLEINQQYADEAQRNAKLEELSKSVQERYAKHLEERAAALTSAHTAFESGLLSAQVYRQMGVDMKAGDLLENFQEEVAMKESLERARDVAKRVALGQDGSDTPHIQITPEYRELRAEALGEPPRIIYQVGRGRGSKSFPGKTSAEVEEIARRWKGSPIVEVDTVDKRLAALNKRFAPQIAESRERMRAALGPILDEDEALMAAFESQAIFDSASELPKGVVELLLNPRFWGERAPYAGGFVEIGYLASVAASAEKLKRGEQMTDGEAIMLQEALIEMKRENSWWGQVLDFTVSSASFGVELGTTGGVATATKKGAMELAGLGLRRLATVEGRQEVEKLLLTRLALGTIGLAGQTVAASASHVASKAFTDLHFEGLEMHRGANGKVIFGLEAGYQPGSPWEKLRGAFVHQMVENGSERLGGFIKAPGVARAFQRMSTEQQEAVVKEGLFQAFAQKMGAEKAAKFLARANERLAKLEIQGIPEEIAEEYAAALGHTVFEGEKFSPPSFEDITALMASMVISRGGSMAVEGVMGNDGSGGGKQAQMPVEVGDGAARDTTDADIWKPVTGGGIYEVDESNIFPEASNSTPGEQRLEFSTGESDAVARRAIELGADSRRFRRGKPSSSKDLAQIFSDYSLKENEVAIAPYTLKNETIGQSFLVTHKTGGRAVVNVTKDGTVWVDTQEMGDVPRDPVTGLEIPRKEGEKPDTIKGGDLVYQAAMTYAYNNGLKFRSDPSGTTAIAKGRRISHMISSALRHGTTRHLFPYGTKKKDNDLVANEWRNEDTPDAFEHNMGLMLRAEMEFARRAMAKNADLTGIELEDLHYDPASDNVLQQVKDEHGTLVGWRRISQGDFATLVEGLVSRNSGVGPTTLSRALITKSELEGHAGGLGSGTHVETAKVLGGREIPPGAGVELLRLLGTAENPRQLYYSRGEGSNSERVQRTGVTREETAAAETRLKSTAQGRAIYGNVLIVDNRAALDGLQGHPGPQRYHAEDWDIMRDAEGFHDPRDGTVVIFRDNVRVLEGETAAQALARVVVHERVGHHGFDALRNSDSKFAEEWKKLAAAIPSEQMKELEARYTHLNGNREALALEWFAHQVGNMEGRAQLEPGSVMQRMWQALRDWVVRKMQPLGDPSKEMSQETIDAHVRGLIRATQRSMVKGTEVPTARGKNTTRNNTLLGRSLQFSSAGNEQDKNETSAIPSASQGTPQVSSSSPPLVRPSDWQRVRTNVDTRKVANTGRELFREVYKIWPYTIDDQFRAYLESAAPAEIAAVAKGRKPLFHDSLGDEAKPLAEKLARILPDLHVEEFGGHLVVADLEQAAIVAGTIDRNDTIAAIHHAIESDNIGEFLGYGVRHWSEADTIVEFRRPSGEVIAGFHGRSETIDEFIRDRAKDYADASGEDVVVDRKQKRQLPSAKGNR